jgi:DNA-binding winged helix-turn-helix (wHTH) protein/Tfp pilus assembly protein PilF
VASGRKKNCFEFGPFRLDTEARALWREGRQVPLTPKAYDTLLELVRGGGRVVGRDELMRRVWPDSYVEEGNLKVTVFMLRKALEENPSEPRYIQTVARRGYRFASEVVETEDCGKTDATGPAEARRVGKAPDSIAVLPFKLFAAESADDYLGLGLADAIIVRLSNLRQLVVRPTSAVRRYAGPEQDPVAAGRELRVAAVLDGNIHRAGDRVRVTAQLINVETEAALWAGKFDADFTDIFAVEDSISEQAARSLAPELTGEDRRRLARRHTENVAAYKLYLKGRYHWAKRTSEGMRKAGEYFRAAVDLDPNYAPAYTGLADFYAQLGWLRLLRPADALPKARAAAQKALELDETLAEAHTSLAWARMIYDWEWAEADEGFRRAVELNPNYAVAPLWRSVYFIATGRFEEAVAASAQALELDPLSPIANAVAGWPFYFMRRYDRSIEHYRRALEIEPDNFPALFLLGHAYRQSGELSASVEKLQSARTLLDGPLPLAGLGHAYAAAGDARGARKILRELERLSKERYVCPYDVAGIHAGLGERDEAFKYLERACEERSSWLIFLAVEPGLDALRADPRFADLLRRIGLHPQTDEKH